MEAIPIPGREKYLKIYFLIRKKENQRGKATSFKISEIKKKKNHKIKQTHGVITLPLLDLQQPLLEFSPSNHSS